MTYRPTGNPVGRPRTRRIKPSSQYRLGDQVLVLTNGMYREGIIVWKGSRRFRLLVKNYIDPTRQHLFFYHYEQIKNRLGHTDEVTVTSEIAKQIGRKAIPHYFRRLVD